MKVRYDCVKVRGALFKGLIIRILAFLKLTCVQVRDKRMAVYLLAWVYV